MPYKQDLRTLFVFFSRWFALWLTTVWVYTSVKSLCLTIKLGVPFYDWQWYMPVTAVVTMLLFGVALPTVTSRFHYKKPFFFIFLIWLLIGVNGFGKEQIYSLQDKPPLPLSFWVSGQSFPLSETLLTDLKTAQATLVIKTPLPLEAENRYRLSDILEQLNAYEIQAILFIPASDFLSAPVHKEWLTNAEQVIHYLEETQPQNVRGLIADVEGPRFTSFESFSTSKMNVSAASQKLSHFLQTQQRINPDLPIGATASWPLYLDNLDGDNDLALLYQSSVDPPGNWGFITIMNYSSYYPESWRAYLVARTIQSMAYRYPNRPPIHLIGLAGKGFAWEPVHDFKGVVQDARISRALGVEEIIVFHLTGAINIHGEDFVKQLNTAVNEPQTNNIVTIPFSRLASIWLFSYSFVDSALDLLLGRIWFTFGWLGVSFGIIWWQKRYS